MTRRDDTALALPWGKTDPNLDRRSASRLDVWEEKLPGSSARVGTGAEAIMTANLHLSSRRAFLAGIAFAGMAPPARAGSATIRVAVLSTGTFAWELDIVRAHALDAAADIAIETAEFASPQAAQLALRAGQADIVITDWLYVSRVRSLGERLAFYPYSSAIGAVMTSASSAITKLADLQGKTLAVAGGPLDKGWLIVQGAALRQGFDLKDRASIVYGAPPLLAEKARQGEFDASLNFWNFCAVLEAEGFKRLVGVEDLAMTLGSTGPLANLGYVFREDWASRNRPALARFFDATRKAKDLLAQSLAEWAPLKARLKLPNEAALAIYRDRYAQGIPRRPIEAEEADARKLYAVLAKLGGPELVV
jgi:NitT/TauT family transport system substrate-binding protein